ncbi:MAG: exonuclease domain-containing protein [bacterium]|nr:exonuclease domain-containing protein [bacterium]
MKIFSADKPLAIVDVETTGASPQRDRVLEIAVIRVEKGEVVDTFHTVLDPECIIPATIFSLTGISEQDTKGSPTFNDIRERIEQLLAGAYFVAHNARFDYAFIKSEFTRLGLPFSYRRLCTVELSRTLFPQYKRLDLSTLIDRFNFECEARHRALGDAKVLADFLTHCEKVHKTEMVEQAIGRVLKRVRVPLQVPAEVIESLPENPGVYTFYGEDGEILYIGKSINIKKRVVSHFGNDGSSKQLRLMQEVKDIDAVSTSGELGALLLESHMIKKEQPLYNRMARRAKKLVVALEEEVDGYKKVVLETYNSEDLSSEQTTLGVFKSMSQAKTALDALSQEHTLCPRLIGLEPARAGGKGRGQCFYSQIGRCLGACKGSELSEAHNMRFDMAFKKRRIRAWPYSGPILITEPNVEQEGTGQVFMIDEWRLTGSFSYDEVGLTAQAGYRPFLEKSYIFDYDSYKILIQYLKNNTKNVTLLSRIEAKSLLTNIYNVI